MHHLSCPVCSSRNLNLREATDGIVATCPECGAVTSIERAGRYGNKLPEGHGNDPNQSTPMAG